MIKMKNFALKILIDEMIDIYECKYSSYEDYRSIMIKEQQRIQKLNEESIRKNKLLFKYYNIPPIVDKDVFDYLMEKNFTSTKQALDKIEKEKKLEVLEIVYKHNLSWYRLRLCKNVKEFNSFYQDYPALTDRILTEDEFNKLKEYQTSKYIEKNERKYKENGK